MPLQVVGMSITSLGFAPFGAEAGDGQVSFTLQGKASQNMRVVLDFEGLGASASLDGTMATNAPLLGFSGIAKLTAEKPAAVFAALGSPIASAGGPVALEATIVPMTDGLQFKALSLNLGGQSVSGDGRLSAVHEVKLDLSGGAWRMGDLAALALAPWNGPSTFPTGRFGANWPFGLSGDISLKPASLIDPFGVALTGANLRLISNTQGKSFALRAAGDVQFDAKLQQKGAAFASEGTIAYPVPLDKAFAFSAKPSSLAGQTFYKGTFAGEGYSPLALLRGLSGSGTISFSGLKVNGLAPDPFYAAANAAKTGEELARAFSGLNKGEGVGFAAQEAKCELKDGALHCETLKTDTQEAALAFTASGDVADAIVAAEVVLNSKSQSTLPPMRLLLSGQPGSMGERLDTTALSAKLGTALINKDMEELARLQKEQQKADAEAAKQAEDDKAKYDAFQAQRNELRLQARMIKVFQQQRTLDAARLKAVVDAAVVYGQSILKDERRRLLQRLPAH